MKKLFAIVLALMLCVSLLSLTATAAEASLGLTSAQAHAGGTVTLNIYVNSSALGALDLSYSYDNSMLELVGFTGGGAGWTVGSHAIFYSGGNYNASVSASFTLTFKVKDSAQVGDVANVSVSGTGYTWNEDGMTYEAVYAGASGTVSVVCDHAWDNGVVTKEATCFEDGEKTFTCSKCGETRTEVIPAAHTWQAAWSYNADEHFHACAKCDATCDNDRHYMNIVDRLAPYKDENDEWHNGYYLWDCDICDYQWRETWYPQEEPRVGDIRPMILLGISGVLATLAAVSYVFKRKNVI